MLFPLYVIVAIYLLTFTITLFRNRHTVKGQKISGVRSLLISTVFLFLGTMAASDAHSFIGSAYLFLAILFAAPLFAFGFGRLLATALTWLGQHRVLFSTVFLFAFLSPIVLLTFLEFTRLQTQQQIQERLLLFQDKTLIATFNNKKIILPAHPRFSIFHTCIHERSGLERNCTTRFNQKSALKLRSSALLEPPMRLQQLEIRPRRHSADCEKLTSAECSETSNPRGWCERRTDDLSKAWCDVIPDGQMKFEYRENWPSDLWITSGVDEIAFKKQVDLQDHETASLQCTEKAKSYCKFYFKLANNILVSAYFQQTDKSNAPKLAANALNNARRMWELMIDPESS
ncbi:hypothetical protein FIV00_09000 [Labrenzia sp. THAF82]|uniref:hypothetical protein n=1 Tax=Labrenzia sp. THAF82 TaxID=2587861 RepID=UPI001268E5D6|nr:hypothetical protein [Labrenzia sp. THAF82]QFT30610.1 hypothetical protein FIV00_09000 [Labrenzia sp. THAF82]